MNTPSKRFQVNSALERYRQTADVLGRLRDELFPQGSSVMVICDRYRGPGVVVLDGECPLDHVSVNLPNGNTWRYPLEFVEPHQQP